MVDWEDLRHHEKDRLEGIARKAYMKAETGFFDVFELLGRQHEVEDYGKFITKVELTKHEIKFYGKDSKVFVKTRKRIIER